MVPRPHPLNVAAPLAAAAAALAVRLTVGSRPVDDAYITFRYARNLAEGMGLVYNPGEWVLGTTTPLWAILLAAGHRLLGLDIPLLASALAALADAASAAMVVLLAARLGYRNPWAAGLVGLAWAINPLSVAYASGGMETSLFVCLTLATLTLAAARRHRVAAALGGFLVFVRPEGILVASATVLWLWWQRGGAPAPSANADLIHSSAGVPSLLSTPAVLVPASAEPFSPPAGTDLTSLSTPFLLLPAVRPAVLSTTFASSTLLAPVTPRQSSSSPARPPRLTHGLLMSVPWVEIALATIPVLIYVAVLLLVYGAPVPQSVLAKQVAYAVQQPWLNLGVLLFHTGLPGWSTFSAAALPMPLALLLAACGAATLGTFAVRAARHPAHRHLAWQPFALFGLLYLLFHVVAGFRGARLFPWYLVPLVPLYLLLAAAGLRTLRRVPPLLLSASLVLWTLPAVDWSRPPLPVGFDLRRESTYLEIGRYLDATLPPGAIVAAPEIGALGWTSHRPILDTVGLISPVASRYYPVPASMVEGDNAVPPALIHDLQPAALVALDQFVRLGLMQDPAFLAGYRLVQRHPLEVWQSRAVLVYLRNDLAAP